MAERVAGQREITPEYESVKSPLSLNPYRVIWSLKESMSIGGGTELIASSSKASRRRSLVSELDVLVRNLVLARDGHRCLKCGKTFDLQAAHIRSKGRYSRLRFELLNVITLCLRCHIYWWHREPVAAVQWIMQALPGRLEQLEIMAATAPRVDMKLLRIGLRKEVQDLKGAT